MAESNINKKFFDALLDEKAAKWAAGVAFDRANALPLDQWSVFKTKTDAETYAASNPRAYPGQIVAYAADNNDMVVCVLTPSADDSKLVLKRSGGIEWGSF